MITAGPFTQADGAQTISIGSETNKPWHEVAVSFEDADGNPVLNVATGTMAGAATGVGADQSEAFSETIDIATGERRWRPFFSFIKSITLTPTSLPSDVRYRVTITNSNG